MPPSLSNLAAPATLHPSPSGLPAFVVGSLETATIPTLGYFRPCSMMPLHGGVGTPLQLPSPWFRPTWHFFHGGRHASVAWPRAALQEASAESQSQQIVSIWILVCRCPASLNPVPGPLYPQGRISFYMTNYGEEGDDGQRGSPGRHRPSVWPVPGGRYV